MPSGNVQTFATRRAIVRGFIQPATPLEIYGLGAIRFTIPKAEQTTGRGFTVAVFSVGRHHHDDVVAFDAGAKLGTDTVSSALLEPLTLKAGSGYYLVLYGDELAPTPGSVPSGYSQPGNNPFVTPYPGTAPSGAATSGGQPPQPTTQYTPAH
ncbi:MAG: hypothetical protein NVS2B8_07970 [Vulcanimicrobiaceae bacterium]